MMSHRDVATAFITWLLSSGRAVIALGGKFGRRPVGMLWYEEARQHRSVSRTHCGRVCSGPSRIGAKYRTHATDNESAWCDHRAGYCNVLEHSDGGRSRPEPSGYLSSGRLRKTGHPQCNG